MENEDEEESDFTFDDIEDIDNEIDTDSSRYTENNNDGN